MCVEIFDDIVNYNNGSNSLSPVEQYRNDGIKKIIRVFEDISHSKNFPVPEYRIIYNIDSFLCMLKEDNESKVENNVSNVKISKIGDNSIERELTYTSNDYGSLICKIHFADGVGMRYLDKVVFEINGLDSENQNNILNEFKTFLEEVVKKRHPVNNEKNGEKSDGNS